MHLRTFMSAAMGSIGVLAAKEACIGNVAFMGEEEREEERDEAREAERRFSKFMIVLVLSMLCKL